MRLAFDADALIFSAQQNNNLGARVLKLLNDPALDGFRFGSALLLPELLTKPTRLELKAEIKTLMEILAKLELVAMDVAVAALAVELGAAYKLKAPDAIHLAAAVSVGATAFVTNNSKNFEAAQIIELQIVSPNDL